MGKRLNRSEYFLTYMIIISLACFIGGFFLGAGVMKAKSQSEIETITKEYTMKMKMDQLEKEKKLYKEMDFAQFYHNVIAPLETFKKAHFEYAEQLNASSSGNLKSISKDAIDQADDVLKEIEQVSIPDSSPLLKQAKLGYIQSLQAYTDGMNQFLDGDTSEMTKQDLIQMRHLEDFKRKWLRAQADLYKAFALWEEMYVTNKPLVKTVSHQSLSLAQWKSYPFHLRDYIAAEQLYRSNEMVEFNPEDLTARVDSIIDSNQAAALGWKDIPFAFRVLDTTDAVREGDFKSLKKKLYPSLKSPEMPFFTE